MQQKEIPELVSILEHVSEANEKLIRDHDDQVINTYLEFLSQLKNARYCRKCKSHLMESPGVKQVSHHPNVIRGQGPLAPPFPLCKYVVTQKWADFMVGEKSILDKYPAFALQLKKLLTVFHQCTQELYPPLDWHFHFLFPH